jgi:DNA-binding CsgD family transcriptional regulator
MPPFLRDGIVRGIAEDASGALWFCVHGRGLVRYDPATGEFDSFDRRSAEGKRLSGDSVVDICRDSKGRIWAATTGEGLNRFDPASRKFVAYRHSPQDPRSLGSDDVRVVYEDREGVLWIGTYDAGLCRLTWMDVEETLPLFTSFRHRPGDPSSLSSDSVLSLWEDKEGILWIGTLDGGLNRFDRDKEVFRCYLERDGLASNTVYGILEDASGNLWLSTNNGLSEFRPGTGSFRNYDVKDGLQSPEFNSGAHFRSQTGELFFGGINGLNTFEPEKMRKSLYIPPVVITGIRPISRKNQPASEIRRSSYPDPPDKLKVSYKDAVLEIGFAALDYSNPAKNRFAYKIEGRDKDWLSLGSTNRFTTPSLPPGDYLFRIKGSNSDGIWNETGAAVMITVIPPFWGTRAFLVILGLMALGSLAAAARLRRRIPASLSGDETGLEPVFLKYGISKREQEIIRLILRGKSNREIEKELFISLSTVKNHIYNIYQKTGVKNRYGLIVLFRSADGGKP